MTRITLNMCARTPGWNNYIINSCFGKMCEEGESTYLAVYVISFIYLIIITREWPAVGGTTLRFLHY